MSDEKRGCPMSADLYGIPRPDLEGIAARAEAIRTKFQHPLMVTAPESALLVDIAALLTDSTHLVDRCSQLEAEVERLRDEHRRLRCGSAFIGATVEIWPRGDETDASLMLSAHVGDVVPMPADKLHVVAILDEGEAGHVV